MAHKNLRHREHHRALEARFSPTTTFGQEPSATPTPSSNPAGGGGGVFDPIFSPPSSGGPGSSNGPNNPNPPGNPNHPVNPNRPNPTLPSPVLPTLPTSTPGTIPTNTRPVPLPNPTPSSDSSNTLSTPISSSSTPATPLVVQTTPSTSLTPSTTRQVPTDSTVFTTAPVSTFPAASSLPAVTPSPTGTSSSLGTGPIVGLAAAGVAGIAVLGVAGVWLFKKYVSHKSEPIEEPAFTRHSWMRNSMALPDEPTDGMGMGGVAGAAGIGTAAASQGPSNRPRPPTMIERHQANFAAMRSPSPGQQQGSNYNGNMAGYGYGGYDSPYAAAGVPPVPVMRSVSPGQTYASYDMNPQPYHNPIASPPPMGHSPEPSNGPGSPPPGAPVAYFTRHNGPSSPPPSGSLPNPYIGESNGGYATMERGTSFTPFQAQTYNEISQQLERSPFADSASSHNPVVSNSQQIPVGTSSVPAAHPQHSGNMTKGSSVRRPETVYDEEDAYGGI